MLLSFYVFAFFLDIYAWSAELTAYACLLTEKEYIEQLKYSKTCWFDLKGWMSRT